MAEWQPIETAPCVGKKRLLVKLANGKTVVGYRHANSKMVVPEFAGSAFLAVCWMPLPTPPAQETK